MTMPSSSTQVQEENCVANCIVAGQLPERIADRAAPKAGLKTRLYFNLMTTIEMSSIGRPKARTSFLIAS
jgi:hypothetical protein